LRGVRSLIQAAQPHAVTLGQSALQTSLLDWSNDLAAFEAKLATIDSIRDESQRLTNDPLAAPSPITDGLKALRATIEALPDQTATEAARAFLTVAQDRWTQRRQAGAKAKNGTAAHKAADAVNEKYTSVADAARSTLDKSVEAGFSSFYPQINSDDEPSFDAG